MLPSRSETDIGRHRIPPTSALCFAAATTPGTAELMLAGEIDLANCGQIAADVEHLCRGPDRRVRIDLGAVTFIDAAAVGAFVRAYHRARALGCELVLRNVHGLPRRVLELLDLDTVLIEQDEADDD
jgi:anti-anti-sigma factor